MIERQTAAILTEPGIAHGFFLRHGGVSEGIYASLNCGPGSRDEPDSVAENRRRVTTALGTGIDLVTLSQVHSATVHAAPLAPRTANAHTANTRTEGDGLVTATPGVALGILTADCAPVLFADTQARVIGAAHAGWKGAVAGVLENTIAAMETLGADRARIRAAIGPAISQDNYEVGWELRDKVLEQGGLRMRSFFVPSGREGHYRFDLKGYAAHRLARAGLASVETLPACTYPPENGFFSFRRTTHRAEPDYGRQVSAIALLT